MGYPPVVVVDENDQVVGSAMLADAWREGLIHRIVYVIVRDDHGRILLHRRPTTMQLFPGRWDIPGGHVDVTPDYAETAAIELAEETGIHDAPLTEIFHTYVEEPYDNGVYARRFVKIFHTVFNGTIDDFSNEETLELRWFTQHEIAVMAAHHAGRIAEGLNRCIPFILKV